MKKLANCGVVFNKAAHTYSLDGFPLQGITDMLHRRLFPDMYDYIPENVLKKAAERGSAIHEACEAIDNGKHVESEHTEVDGYRMLKTKHNLMPIASEYLVTDSNAYASAIDKVYESKDGVILGDIKTTSRVHEEYVSWQLSIYARWFEQMNPDIKVVRLVCVWLKNDIAELIDIERKDIKLIDDLLDFDQQKLLEGDETTQFEYKRELPDFISANQHALISITRKINELQEEKKAIEQLIKDKMNELGTKSIDSGAVLYTMTSDSVSHSFDSKKFKTEHEDMYGLYLKEVMKSGGLRITIR